MTARLVAGLLAVLARCLGERRQVRAVRGRRGRIVAAQHKRAERATMSS